MITEQQRLERRKYIGSSDCAAVFGKSKWATPLSLWAEKTGQVIPEDISAKMYVKLGNKLEDIIADLFTEETGKKVHRVNETVYHPKYSFIAANLDRRVVGEKALLECKKAEIYKKEEWEGEEIPESYIYQCYHQLACTDYDRAYIAVLLGNSEFRWKCIERDKAIINNVIEGEVNFWKNFVEPKIMPALISCKDSLTLYNLFPEPTTPEIVLNDEADLLIEQIEALETDYSSLKGQIEQKKNALKAMLKEAESGKSSRYTVTWKQQVKKAYTVPESKTRVLRIKENKEEKE